jgi:hypothetical protein
MEKKLLKEINEIRSMMGLSLLTETIVDDIGKLFLNVLKKGETETIIIKGFVQPRTVKEIFETLIKGFDTLPAKEQKAVIKFMGTKEGKVFLTAYEAALAAYKKSPNFDKATFISYNKQAKLIKDELAKVTATVGSKSTSSASSSSGSISNKSQSTVKSQAEKEYEALIGKKKDFGELWNYLYDTQLKNVNVGSAERAKIKEMFEKKLSKVTDVSLMEQEIKDEFYKIALENEKNPKKINFNLSKKIGQLVDALPGTSKLTKGTVYVIIAGLFLGIFTFSDVIEKIKSMLSPGDTTKSLIQLIREMWQGGVEGATGELPIKPENPPNNTPNPPNNPPNPPNNPPNKEEKPSEPKQDDYRSDDSY